ncbi:glycosyl transferase [Devosia pacifica]|uniref:Glycosyl transferase n=1 Tax=Devosia pacifica TaxID=1335967 RepID=A0A918SFB8_9HYPH|nr:glycosyl transferase [Devosia pacifica]
MAAEAKSETSQSCTNHSGERICITRDNFVGDTCVAIASFADRWNLPPAFFARLIWQESRFDPEAISPAGAQGIAQFMPGTARLRALANPFDSASALAYSAEYLSALAEQFGNLGLAAVAYNAGEGRAARILAGRAGAPLETRGYVEIITGQSVEYWLAMPEGEVDFALDEDLPFDEACRDMAAAIPLRDPTPSPGAWQPWGILIAQNYSPATARQRFEQAQARFSSVLGDEQLMMLTVRNPNFGPRARYSAMVGRSSREAAQALCSDLLAAGGNCIVQKND